MHSVKTEPSAISSGYADKGMSDVSQIGKAGIQVQDLARGQHLGSMCEWPGHKQRQGDQIQGSGCTIDRGSMARRCQSRT